MRPSIRNCWHLVGRASEGNDVTDRNSQPSRRRGSVLWVLVLLGFGLGLVCAPALAQTRYRYHRPKVSAEKPKMTSARAERRDLSGSSTESRSRHPSQRPTCDDRRRPHHRLRAPVRRDIGLEASPGIHQFLLSTPSHFSPLAAPVCASGAVVRYKERRSIWSSVPSSQPIIFSNLGSMPT